MGCQIRITVQTTDSKNDKDNQLDVDDDHRFNKFANMDPDAVEQELGKYLRDNKELLAKHHPFDAIQKHKRRLQSFHYHPDVRNKILDHQRHARGIMHDMARERREALAGHRRQEKRNALSYW